jgi:2-polyprenyl-3-methyl-5-hydroxy-6-metoxy-1,4-benzoquinol methylase
MNSCVLCGNEAVRELRLSHTVIWRCRANDCGLEFASPQLDDDILAHAYRTLLYPATDDSHAAMYEGTPDSVFREVLPQLEARLGPLKGLRLLDYGCGRGQLSRIAFELGLVPVGIEPDSVARSISTATAGVSVYANLGELRLREPSAEFDLVILWNVIEHLRKPWLELREICGLLRPSGQLLVSTMNTRCLRARIERGRWLIYGHPTHFYYFHRRSLESVLRGGGFRRVQEWKPKIHYPQHGPLRRWFYEVSTVLGVSDGLYYLCSNAAEAEGI